MRFDYVFKDTTGVAESQVVQRRPGEIVIRVVPRATFTVDDERMIREGVERWISPSLDVEIEPVEAIEREANGKLRAVKSLLGQGS
jgi:phenylacetate-CoA ligase